MIYRQPKFVKCQQCNTSLKFKKIDEYKEDIIECRCGFFGWWINGEIVPRIVRVRRIEEGIEYE